MAAGIVGVITAMKPNAFTYEQNQRWYQYSALGLLRNLFRIIVGKGQVFWQMRKIIERCNDYKCLVDRVSWIRSVAPYYVIVSGVGPNEGAVISRDRYHARNVRTLNETNWFLV